MSKSQTTEHDYDDDPRDWDEEDGDDFDECGLGDDGQCALAGTEHCDFECSDMWGAAVKALAAPEGSLAR